MRMPQPILSGSISFHELVVEGRAGRMPDGAEGEVEL